MTYEKAFNLLDLKNLSGFVSQLEILASPMTPVELKRKELGLSSDFYFIPFHPEIYNWVFDDMWNKIVSIYNKVAETFTKVTDIAKRIVEFVAGQAVSYWNWIWNTLGDFMWYVSALWKKFMADPKGYIVSWVTTAVTPLIAGIKTIISVTYAFAYDLWSYLQNWMSPLFDVVKNTIVNWITDRINAVKGWIDAVKTSLTNFWNDVIAKFTYYYDKVAAAISSAYSGITSVVNNVKDSLAKVFDYGLGGVADAIKKSIENIFVTMWEWTKDNIMKVSDLLVEPLYLPIWNKVKGAWDWLVKIFKDLWEGIKTALYRLAPSAPEQGEALMSSALEILGLGVAGFGALTGVSMVVSWLSKHHLGHLSALLYDMSSYKYITAAVMGGLVTAAYAQPLKYFFNAKFLPYLPDWMTAQMALGRSKISPELFKFFQKYAGVSEKYFDIYQVLARRPISAFMIRYIADAEITDPVGIFRICMDNGYSVEHAAFMAFAMTWGANGIYRRGVFAALQRCYKEGFISKSRLDSEIDNIKSTKLVSATYYGIYGYSISAQIKIGLDQKALIALASEWDLFNDSILDKLATLKTLYGKEAITESGFRSGLVELGIVPNRIEDIVGREKVKKIEKEEPDKGKDLRKELKTVLTSCYKEGLITKDLLDEEVRGANVLVDEETLIFHRAEWEAFKDDMMDWRTIYVSSLADGLITEAEFRSDLIDMGFRATKVELLIKYDKAKKAGRAAK